MDKLHVSNKLLTVIGNWDWQPQKLKEQFGQLLYKDVQYEVGKEDNLLNQIGNRLKKTIPEVIIILKNL